MNKNSGERHYAFKDSMFVGTPGEYLPHDGGQMPNKMTLFGEQKTQQGVRNELSAAVFNSGEIFLLVALRVHLGFFGCRGSATWNTATVAINDALMMGLAQNSLELTLRQEKTDLLEVPAWYCPAGGGPAGAVSQAAYKGDPASTGPDYQSVVCALSNGVPSPQATMQLAEPLEVRSDNLFEIDVDVAQAGDADFANVLNNLTTGFAVGQVVCDGYFTMAAR